MANTGIEGYYEQEDDTVLSHYTSLSAKVGAWCIELPPEVDDGSPVDSEFRVLFWYRNHKDGASKSIMFKVNREEIKAYFDEYVMGSHERWETVVVLDWLDELGVSRDEVVYLVVVDIVLDGFERLLDEVQTRGRKSLDMSVEIEVLAVDDEDEYMVDDKFEYEFEEGFGFVEEEEEEVLAVDDEDEYMVDDELEYEFEEGFGFEEEEEEVLAVDDEDEYMVDDEFEYEFEEGFGFVEEEEEEEEEVRVEDEEVKKANMEVAKVVLSTSGVKFVEVSSSMSYEQVGPCAICLEDFEDDIKKSSDDDDHMEEDEVVVVAILRCSHILHQDCLLPWVAKGNLTCPLCRDDMLSVARSEREAGLVQS